MNMASKSFRTKNKLEGGKWKAEMINLSKQQKATLKSMVTKGLSTSSFIRVYEEYLPVWIVEGFDRALRIIARFQLSTVRKLWAIFHEWENRSTLPHINFLRRRYRLLFEGLLDDY